MSNLEIFEPDDSSYVMSSCTECRRRMRANHLHNVTVEVQSGRRSGSSRSNYFGKRPSTRSGRSSSTYYKNVNKRMCDRCYDRYQAKTAREAKIKLIFGVIVCSFFGYLFFYGKSDKSPPTESETTPQSSASNIQARWNESANSHDSTSSSPITTAPLREQEAIAPPPEPPPPLPPPPEDYYTTNHLANVRSAPNNGPIIGQLSEGEEVSVVETRGLWVRVRRGDTIVGWMHKAVLDPSR